MIFHVRSLKNKYIENLLHRQGAVKVTFCVAISNEGTNLLISLVFDVQVHMWFCFNLFHIRYLGFDLSFTGDCSIQATLLKFFGFLQVLFFGGADKLPTIVARHTIYGVVVDPCAAILVCVVALLLCLGIKEVFIICFCFSCKSCCVFLCV